MLNYVSYIKLWLKLPFGQEACLYYETQLHSDNVFENFFGDVRFLKTAAMLKEQTITLFVLTNIDKQVYCRPLTDPEFIMPI